MANIFSDQRRYAVTSNTVSDKTFYLVMALTLFFGFAVNAIEVVFLYDFFITMNPIVFLVAYIVLYIVGMLMNTICKNPILNFIGYCMVVLPLGALLSIYVPAVGMSAVRAAYLATAMISVIMGLLAIMYPNFFYSMYKLLAVCLLVAVLYQFVAILLRWSTFDSWIDWLVVIIFSCYIGFDIAMAKDRPRTIRNAFASAGALYVDVILVAIRLMRIFSRD